MGDFLRAEVAAGRGYLPAGDHVLRAFSQPLDDVRVLIVGQDPYPTPGHPVGLSFSVAPDVRPVPRSLQNIYQELGHRPRPADARARRPDAVGRAGRAAAQPGAHRAPRASRPATRARAGRPSPAQAIAALVARGGPLVAILWGRDAQRLAPLLGDVPRIESPHPSPLSASSGFFGSRPFSRANDLLRQQGADPIDWRLT